MFESRGSLVIKTPVMSSTTLFPKMSVAIDAWATSAYGDMYRRHLWVYAVVNKLANGLSRLPLKVYQRDELNRPTVDGHPMATLLAAPNPGISPFDLWFWVSATQDVYGEAFLYKRRVNGVVTSLWPLHPTSMYWDDQSEAWTYSSGRIRLDLRDVDVIQFKRFNPGSIRRGLSPMEPLRATLENEWAARTATSSFWRGGARPGTVLTHPRRISDAAQTRLKAQWDALTSGADKVGATVILEEGMKPEIHQITAEEAQYVETRRLNREEVCGAYDVPPPAVHILDRATFSNITEQLRSLYRDTMGPRCRAFEATLMTDLKAAEWPDDPVYVEFLMDDVLRGDFEQRQDALAKATHMTIAEKRRIENLPFIDGTDRIFLNTATMPLDAIDAQAQAIAEGRTPTATDLVRTLMGRLSWQSSLAEVDLLALTEGIDPADASKVAAHYVAAESLADLKNRLKEAS